MPVKTQPMAIWLAFLLIMLTCHALFVTFSEQELMKTCISYLLVQPFWKSFKCTRRKHNLNLKTVDIQDLYR